MDTQKLIETLLERIEILEKNNAFLMKRVYDLETELAIYKNKKNSKNSHTPPSQDQNRVKKNQSLREKVIVKQVDNLVTKAIHFYAQLSLMR